MTDDERKYYTSMFYHVEYLKRSERIKSKSKFKKHLKDDIDDFAVEVFECYKQGKKDFQKTLREYKDS